MNLLGCHNKVPQTEWLKHQKCISDTLSFHWGFYIEARKPRSRHQQGWFIWRPLLGLLFSCWVVSDPFVTPGSAAHHAPPWDFPSKNPGVGCHFLLQGIFPAQGLNLHLLHCRRSLCHWATRETSPRLMDGHFLCLRGVFPLGMCILTSPSYKSTHHIELGPTQWLLYLPL